MAYIDIYNGMKGIDAANAIKSNWEYLKTLKEQSPGVQLITPKNDLEVLNVYSEPRLLYKKQGVITIVLGGANRRVINSPFAEITTNFLESEETADFYSFFYNTNQQKFFVASNKFCLNFELPEDTYGVPVWIYLGSFTNKVLPNDTPMASITFPAVIDGIRFNNPYFVPGQLDDKITAERVRAMAAEEAIATDLQAEVERAEGAESDLMEALEEETERATTAENEITEALEGEVERAMGAESDLSLSIAAEYNRALEGEAAALSAANLYTDAETTRATTAEGALSTSLETEVERATEAEAATLVAANLYTDAEIVAAISGTIHYVGDVDTFADLPVGPTPQHPDDPVVKIFDLYHVVDVGEGYYAFPVINTYDPMTPSKIIAQQITWNQLDFNIAPFQDGELGVIKGDPLAGFGKIVSAGGGLGKVAGLENAGAATEYLNRAGSYTTPPNTTYGLFTDAAPGIIQGDATSTFGSVVATGGGKGKVAGLENAGAATEYLNRAGGYSTPPDTKYKLFTNTTSGVILGDNTFGFVNSAGDGKGKVSGLVNTGAATQYLNAAGGYSTPPDTKYNPFTDAVNGTIIGKAAFGFVQASEGGTGKIFGITNTGAGTTFLNDKGIYTLPPQVGGDNVVFTFVVDTDEKLAIWASNIEGNNYSSVLVVGNRAITKSGVAIDLTVTGTQRVTGAVGSSIAFTGSSQAIKGFVTGTYPDLVPPREDYYIENLAITTTSGYGFAYCSNLIGCSHVSVPLTAGSVSFYYCYKLRNCSSNVGHLIGETHSFWYCLYLDSCTALKNTTVIRSGNSDARFYSCKYLTNCYGYGYSSGGGGVAVNGVGYHSCENLTGCIAEAYNGSANSLAVGYQSCTNISGCSAICVNATGNTNSVASTYLSCTNISGCSAIATTNVGCSVGYQSCTNISGCSASVKKNNVTLSHLPQSGYYDCIGVSACTVNINCGSGLMLCKNVSDCVAEVTGSGSDPICAGFKTCENITNCIGTAVSTLTAYTASGFHGCKGVTNCVGTGTRVGPSTADAWGFADCTGMSHNRPGATSATTIYTGGCYADFDSLYPVANTPQGGFNSSMLPTIFDNNTLENLDDMKNILPVPTVPSGALWGDGITIREAPVKKSRDTDNIEEDTPLPKYREGDALLEEEYVNTWVDPEDKGYAENTKTPQPTKKRRTSAKGAPIIQGTKIL
jgi:hypothetical protein